LRDSQALRGLGAGCLAVLALVCAQDVAPDAAAFHDWPYALLLAAVLFLVLRARGRTPGTAGDFVRAGTAIVAFAGLASGLLGPETQRIARAPGTVAPLPDLRSAAFFPSAGAAEIAGAPLGIAFRRRDAPAFEIPSGGHRLTGTFAIAVRPQPAAFVDVRDAEGRRLTVTRPTGAFLSPVLGFPERVAIDGRTYAADGFSVPARRARVRAIYFPSERVTRASTRRALGGRPGILLAVDDEAGRPVSGGIGLAPSGKPVRVGGLRFLVTVGTYPELVVSATPATPAVELGTACIIGGFLLLMRKVAAGGRRGRET